MSANWSIEDPVSDHDSEEANRKAFKDAFMTLNRRIAIFMNLPIDKLDNLSLQNELNRIGKAAQLGRVGGPGDGQAIRCGSVQHGFLRH